MAENFDLIFGQNASQQYAWSDNDYQKGWETIGNIPPTAAQFDALQRRSDTKLKELNDELTPLVNADTADSRQPSTTYSEGDIKYSSLLPTGWFLTCTTAGTTSTSELVLPTPIAEGGTVTDGAVVWTIRKLTTVEIPNASSTVAGVMKLYSSKGTNTDGAMTQQAITNELGNLESLIGSGGGIVAASLTTNGYVKFANGLILQWGVATEPNTDNPVTYVTFPIAFASDCYSVVSTGSYDSPSFRGVSVMDKSKTGCKMRSSSPGRNLVYWHAIGE